MTRMRLRGDHRGLTLIEMVLALTILAIAGALVSGAFATSLRAWQSGFRSGREELVARIVLERISSQLRSAVFSPARRNGEAAVAFDAGEDHVRFVTLSAAAQGPVHVSYALQSSGAEPHLVYREYPWPDKAFFGDGQARREEQVVEITGFSVKVVKRSDDAQGADDPPTDEWSPSDETLPASVSVDITVRAPGGSEPRHYQIRVPVLTQGAP